MDLWQLNILCKVVELKSFSKAGNIIHLSQPTVSSHIKDLEEHFGCRLIDRLAREAVPTRAGELLYSYAKKLLALKDETESVMAEFMGKIQGRLVLGGSTIPGVYILPKITGEFTQKYPDVTISLMIGDTKTIVEDTITGSIELGIVGARINDRRIIPEKLVEDRMCLVVPKGHRWAKRTRVKLEELFSEPFIIRESGSGTLKSLQNSMNQAGTGTEKLKIVAEMGSTAAVIQGIKNNIGISILSSIAVSEETRYNELKAVDIEGLDLKRSFYLTLLKNRTLSPVCRVFIDFLKARMQEETFF
ncbi:selenium metabolism-associated LysR family transcriptional regulator [Desulfobacterales bacterium HSG16]|nr:selenium metabolism-associated LysR family transcriptional regulator [Desulfobacterales bacterium HSG16]